jgi:hypothetical protein
MRCLNESLASHSGETMSNIYLGNGNPAGLIEMDQSGSLQGSRLQFGLLNQPGFVHHMISYRDICFDSAAGNFFFRRIASGNPNNFTDQLVIAANGDVSVRGTLNASAKNFSIPHPLDPQHRRLVHGSIEGPEYAVLYRGQGQISEGSTTVALPAYFEALTTKQGRTVQLTPLADSEEPISALAASEVRDGAFTVRALDASNPNQRFYWEVKAIRSDIEPLVAEVEHSDPAQTETRELATIGS